MMIKKTRIQQLEILLSRMRCVAQQDKMVLVLDAQKKYLKYRMLNPRIARCAVMVHNVRHVYIKRPGCLLSIHTGMKQGSWW
jgi:uncharacterized protein (DUF1810 family)